MSSEVLIRQSALALQSIAPAMPKRSQLDKELNDLAAASSRGYFTPDEDLRLQDLFARYLSARAALHETVNELEPLWARSRKAGAEERLQAFTIGFVAACMLMRSARFIIDHVSTSKTLWTKLNEPVPRYGIPRKQFTSIYRSLTRAQNIARFYVAMNYAESRMDSIRELKELPYMAPVIDLLEQELPHIEPEHSYYIDRIVRYSLHSIRRRPESGYRKVMFGLFKASGCAISEIRNPLHHKRVTAEVIGEISPELKPGDVIITRHDDAASNLFLPGYWPHGALYIGSLEERMALGVEMDPSRKERSADPIRILEAKKDGVLFREMPDTFAVDAFTVIRPHLPESEVAEGLSRALCQEGKLFDFEFDFSRADQVVCTEVVYRGFHNIGGFDFQLTERAGRLNFSAEDLLDHAIDKADYDVVALYGVGDNTLSLGEEARERLVKSYKD